MMFLSKKMEAELRLELISRSYGSFNVCVRIYIYIYRKLHDATVMFSINDMTLMFLI